VTDLQIANVVGMITYHQELELSALAETFEDREEITSAIYEPAENHWLQTRFAPDDTYVAFYRSGRCSIAGCESTGHFYAIAEQVNDVMRDLLEYEYKPEIEISNIVATADLSESIPLEVLAIGLGMENTEYEPEQFPALMYRGSEYVILIFSSGKLLCTGLNDLKVVSETVEGMVSRIQSII